MKSHLKWLKITNAIREGKPIKTRKEDKTIKYYILFEYQGKPVCGCWKEGTSKEEAIEKAEMSLLVNCPWVQYDNVSVTDSKE